MRFTRVLIFIFSTARANLVAQVKPHSDTGQQTFSAALAKPEPDPSNLADDPAIDLLQALGKAAIQAPAVVAADALTASMEGRQTRASSIPNPSLDVEMEKFAGTGSSKGYDNAELRISLAHTLELGSKRARRTDLAAAELNVARVSGSLVRTDVKTRVQLLFNEVLRLQELRKLHENRRKVSFDFLDEASRRFQAGLGTPIEKAKARVSSETAQLDLDRAELDLASALARLSASMGETSPTFQRVKGDLRDLPSLPPKESLIESIDETDLVALRLRETSVRKASLALERSAAVPDLRLSAGVIHTRQDNSKGLLLGASIPLPVFQSNEGGVQEATQLLTQSESLTRAERQSVAIEIETAYRTYMFRRDEARYFEGHILKSADEALAFTMRAFRLGRLNYLEVLEVQRTQFDAKRQYLEALATAQESLIELEKLTKLEFHVK